MYPKYAEATAKNARQVTSMHAQLGTGVTEGLFFVMSRGTLVVGSAFMRSAAAHYGRPPSPAEVISSDVRAITAAIEADGKAGRAPRFDTVVLFLSVIGKGEKTWEKIALLVKGKRVLFVTTS